MDTNKLFKAIQIIVQEEVKKEISLIKEEIRKEVLAEVKKSQPIKQQTSLKSLVEESADPFDLANKILTRDRASQPEEKIYTKNSMLNQVLNETAMAGVRPNYSTDDGGWGTITPEMIGYGDPQMGYQPTNQYASPSAPISTGNDILDKAIARSAKVLAASKDKNR
jgi:hypothetical protein